MSPQYLFPVTILIEVLSMDAYPRCTPNNPGSRVHKALVEEISSSIAFISIWCQKAIRNERIWRREMSGTILNEDFPTSAAPGIS